MTTASSPGLAQKALWGGYSRTGNPSAVHGCYYQRASNDPEILADFEVSELPGSLSL